MDEVDAGGGLIAVASGGFYFLESGSVQKLVDTMARRFPGGRLVYDAESPEMVAMSEQAVRDRGIDAVPMPFRVADPCAAHTWSSHVSQVRVNFDLSSYATDPSALPAQVLDGFAQIREGRALYEVITDFAVAGEPR
jgi:putative O-methyltransferase